MPFLPLVKLADVEERRRLSVVQQPCRGRRVDLVDLCLDLLEKVAISRHWFQKYSVMVSREKWWTPPIRRCTIDIPASHMRARFPDRVRPARGLGGPL